MARPIVCWLAVFVVAASLRAEAQTVITGQVRGADGEVMPATHVIVETYYGRRHALQILHAPDGHYRAEIDQPGLTNLRFAGPLHADHAVLVLVEEGRPVELDVQLRRAWMDTDQSFTRVVTSHTDFAYDSGVALEEEADGTFTALVEAPGDSLVYGLMGAESQSYGGWLMGAMNADRFVYTRDGYRAVIASPDAQVQVAIQPRLPETEQPPQPLVAFGAANERAEALWTFHQQLQDYRSYHFTHAVRMTEGASADGEAHKKQQRDHENVMRQEVLALEIDIEKETDAFRRDLLLMLYLSRTSGLPFWGRGTYRIGMRFDAIVASNPTYIARALDVIPPTSMGWGVHPALLQVLIEQTDASEAARAYVEDVVATHPMDDVRRFAFFNLIDGLFARRGLTPEVKAYMEQFRQTYGEDDLIVAMPPEEGRQIVVGRRAPSLGRASGARPTAGRVAPADSLEGRVVLLDFWASWCDECLTEEANLRQAHAAYYDGGFQVMRVSLDYEPRPEPGPDDPPWLFHQGEDGFKSRIAVSFEVMTLPHRVLIDGDGVVLAVGDDLFGDRLLETLQRVFTQ